ncbi:LAFA_0A01024g1_1 [Lachancea sp. 'fantastica']|nr:LAFA_0A01024g1_1 [Lachancea sp. 'fantastica']
MPTDHDDVLEFGLKELKLTKRVNDDRIAANNKTSHSAPTVPRVSAPGEPTRVSLGESDAKTANIRNALSKSSEAIKIPNTEEEYKINDKKNRASSAKSESDSDSDTGSDSSREWSTVPAISTYDIYNKSGELALAAYQDPLKTMSSPSLGNSAAEHTDQPSKQKKSSTFGYTKVADEQQAQRSQATNKKTDFLFNHKVMNESSQSLKEAGTPSEQYDEYEDAEEHESELNSRSQLSFTKNLLSEREKIAYVGSISVLANTMCTQLALSCICTNVTGRKKLAQRLQHIQRDMGLWRSTLVSKLSEHLEISPEEVKMIERLAVHGIALEDLCKCLKVAQVVENPWETQNTVDRDPDLKQTDISNPPPSNIINPEDLKKESELRIGVAWTIVCDLFLLLVSGSRYDARSRTLFIKFAEVLNISETEICEFERRVIDALDMEQSTEEQEWNETEHMKSRRKKNKRKKLCYVGLATIGGSLVLGLSGGLLAPVIGAGIAAGLTTAGITGATGFLTGVGGTAVVAATSTAIGAKIGTEAMSKRMGSVRTFEFSPLHNNRRVNLILSVSGWMTGNEDDVRLPFSTVDPIEGDLYSLHWEPEMLKSTGQTINILASEIFTQTLQQILGATILTAFMSAVQMPMMLSKLGYLIDNPWNVSLDRAWAAGLILADTLISRNLGQRPVTLIGFSLGARVIYSCLVELCKRKATGLIENVYLFGSPVVYNREQLVMIRSVVSGRLVNGYSDKDWILCYLFRATSGGFKSVIGISEIKEIEGIENYNCSGLVEGHMTYRKSMPKLLKAMGISVLSEEFVDIEETSDPEQLHRQRQIGYDIEKAQKASAKKKRASWVPGWMKPKKAKWQEMYEESAIAQSHKANDVDTDTAACNSANNGEKTDKAIVNASALMQELDKLKKEAASFQAEAPISSPSEHATNTGKTPLEDKRETSEFETTKNSLMGAGKVLLPEDPRSFHKKDHEPIDFAFSDDF